MFKLKTVAVFALIAILFTAGSVFALDTLTLRQNMWKWASLEAVLSESLHFNFGHHYTPVLSPEEAYNEIELVRSDISKTVASIDNDKDMMQAREVADYFQNMHGHEAEVGKTLHKLLDMQEKYISIHGS
ncbi:MAG: hypothetical protein PWR01_3511 [Clostridiales bacterium]|jgi:hypothetical protein|nr:hypothetical protein [Clostridiales bacterium]MDN5282438.1 hypothetical protein [Candidatus Ozemobacter sp.]